MEATSNEDAPQEILLEGQEEINSVKALLGLAIMQIEEARMKLGNVQDAKEASRGLKDLHSLGIAAGVLEYVGTVIYGFPIHERFGMPGIWTQSKLEGIGMATEFSSKFNGVIYNSVDICLYSDQPKEDDPDFARITKPVRVALFDVLGTGRAVNAVQIDFKYEFDDEVQATWMGVWQANDGVFLDSVEIRPSVELSGRGTFVVNPGGLMLE